MADHPPRPGFEFPAPAPREALEYFRFRKLKVGFDYRDVWLQEHARAFTVAKAMNVGILNDIRDALDRAIAEGRTLEQFRKDLTPLLQRRGWWGKKVMTDPRTGKQVVAQLGSPRRLRTIYRANLRAARAAGIWDRAQRTKWGHPYFLYQLGPSKEHRDKHRAWAGTLLPVDDDWWNDHFPPNGWGCKCSVRQVSRREAERRGGPTAPPPRNEVRTRNRRTGKVQTHDDGVDPAWASNPGKDRDRILMDDLNGKLDRSAYDIARGAIRSVFESPVFDRFRKHPRGDLPAGVLDREVRTWIGAKFAVARLPDRIMNKQQGRIARPRKNLGHSKLKTEDYRRLPALLEAPEVVYRPEPPADLPPQALNNRLCLWGEVDEKSYFAVVDRDPVTDKVDVISFFRRDLTKKQRANLLGRAQEVLRKPKP